MELPENHELPVLEPKMVSGWLELPGAQLPRETAKIIGQPAQPARKKGASARYSVQDAILMKLGRVLTDLGVTPHRVRACVEVVRKNYIVALKGLGIILGPGNEPQGVSGPFYIVGRETTAGFRVGFVPEEDVSKFITQSGIMEVNREEALREAMSQRLKDALETGKYPSFEELTDLKTYKPRPDDDRGDGFVSYGQIVPGSPAIVQDVTQFVQDQTRAFQRYMDATEARPGR